MARPHFEKGNVICTPRTKKSCQEIGKSKTSAVIERQAIFVCQPSESSTSTVTSPQATTMRHNSSIQDKNKY